MHLFVFELFITQSHAESHLLKASLGPSWSKGLYHFRADMAFGNKNVIQGERFGTWPKTSLVMG